MHKSPFFPLGLALSAILCAPLALPVAVAVAAPVSISAVQGAGAQSPLLDQTVTVRGVVTGDFRGPNQFDGFFVQDPMGDGDAATSDALFVYLGARSPWASVRLQPGDRVQISGRVAEFKGQTQLGSLTEVQVTARGEAMEPQTVELGPDSDWESLENMAVRFAQTLVVSAQNDLARYGTLKLAVARPFNPTNQRPIEEVRAAPQSEISILLDDGSGDANPKITPYLDAQNTRRAGSTVSGVTGIVTQYGADYRIEPTQAPVFGEANPRPLAPPAVGGTLRVAGANVLNYWTTFKNQNNPDARGASDSAQFERQSAKIMAAMRGLDADVLGVMELENNPATVAEFTRRLNAVYGADEYAAIADPAAGLGGDAIRVGLFYKTSKVEPLGPARAAADAIFERFPLAQTFRDKTTGGVFTVVVNHFKSKGSAPQTGDVDFGEGAWNFKRTQQAQQLLAFVEQLKQTSGDPDVLVLGDLNAYTQETPLRTLTGAGLKHLNLRLAPEDRYSFSFDGLFGSLDHALATPTLDAQITGFGEWHINADEPFFHVYNRIKADDYRPDPYRSSDHDPLVIGLNLTAD